MQPQNHHAPMNTFSSAVPWRALGLLVVTLFLLVAGVQLLRWAMDARSAPLPEVTVSIVDDVQTQIFGVDERIPAQDENGNACTNQSCANVASNMSVANDVYRASMLASGLDGPPATIPNGSTASLRSKDDGQRVGDSDGPASAAIPSVMASKALKRPRFANGMVKPSKPKEVLPQQAPFASDTLQKLVGQRADRLLTGFLQTRRGGGQDVTKVVVSYAMVSGCNVVVEDVNVRAKTAEVATQVQDVMREGIPQRLSAPGCAQMEGRVGGDVTVINVPAPLE